MQMLVHVLTYATVFNKEFIRTSLEIILTFILTKTLTAND